MTRIARLLVLITILLPAAMAFSGQGDTTMPEYNHYVLRLHPVRPEMAYDMTEHEAKIMGEHFQYLKRLTQEGKVLAAGPVFGDPVYGLCVLKADEPEAKEIGNHDPSVIAGVNTFDIEPLNLALFAHNIPSLRYPDTVSDRILQKSVTVPGTLDDVWTAWTTTEGLQSFFSPNAKTELRVGGPFEIQFDMSVPYGKRGSEDCFILSYLPKKMLSFEWNSPPKFEDIRNVHHFVVLEFEPVAPDSVKVSFSELGWGVGEQWDNLYQYFDRAWDMVLGNFAKRMQEGPLEFGKK